MKKFVFSVLLLTLVAVNAFAQIQAPVNSSISVDDLFGTRKEIVFTFHADSKDQINNDLTNVVSIDRVRPSALGGYDVTAYANKRSFTEFLTRGIAWTEVVRTAPKAYNMATTTSQMSSWDRYPTYSVYEQLMADFANNFPAICRLDTILASTPGGHKILALKISDNVNQNENEPRFLYSSSMHGDETTGIILMLRLINDLLTNYNSSAKILNLVNNIEIWICPMANPDGTYASGDNTINGTSSTRGNAAGEDLNRNYPDPRAGNHPDGLSWQPETQAFMAFAELHHFNMSANFHGGAELLNYPWDTWTTSGNPNASAGWWQRVCTAYVDTCQLVDATYMTDMGGVTEGGDWFVITGGRQDYMNYFQYCREVTAEIDVTKTTETQNLGAAWNRNYRGLYNYMQESLFGLRGLVTDSCSGLPIKAKVWISSYDQANDSSQVYSFLPVGDYHKYLTEGTYSVTFSAPGYASKTVNNVVIANGSTTVVNVAFAPSLPAANFIADETSTCTGVVNFSDLSTGGANSWSWDFGDGTGSTSASPTHAYTTNGTYTVSLTVSNCKGSNTATRTSYITVNLPAAPTVNGDSICGAGTVNLSATGSGTLSWYDAPINGNLVNTGTAFSPSLSSTTTYYVASEVIAAPVAGGKPDNTGAGGNLTNQNQYEIFDCTTACTLVSVKVYASTLGNRTFELRNSSGTVLQSATVNITSTSGAFTVPLNFSVPVGTNLQLGLASSSTCDLYRNSGSVSYPYTTAGLISVKTSSAASTPLNYYYYVYDWQIQAGSCSSARIAVTGAIKPIPVASFGQSLAGTTATFSNTSSDATSWYWNFGDGQSSTQQNPSHTYSTDGTYNVMLIANNSCGSDTVWNNVVIGPAAVEAYADQLSQIGLYPNPAKDVIYISFNGITQSKCEYEFINMVGQSVLKGELTFTDGNTSVPVNIGGLLQGVYFVKLRMDGETVTRKTIIE